MSETDPLVGKTLGSCRLEAFCGRGGMGRVYKARHLALDRVVAVKLFDLRGAASNGALRAQILAEARSAAKFENPRIVAIYEVGEERGIPYIVMQWVEGESIEAQVARRGRLPPAEALEIIRETATALSAAHKAGLVHRDIKPGNILVDARGAVKLADFGIARPIGAVAAAGESASGSFHFMAPEQAYGGVADPRSDLYSLGATWYYTLTAQPPYPGSEMDALLRHRDEPPPEARLLCPEITERAADLLRRLMAKAVDERPTDAQTVLKEMLSAGMLLDTDASGSPFKILPAPAGVVASPRATAALSAEPVFPPPRPPAPAAAATLGTKSSFVGLLAVFGISVFGWEWRRAGPEDWAAGVVFFSVLPAALTWGERGGIWRKWLRGLGCAGAMAGWYCQVFSGGWVTPPLESGICAGIGLCALFGSVLLGQWGRDRSEAAWARALGPGAALCLLMAGLTWRLPETQAWFQGLTERTATWWAALIGSGGGWRWLGTAGVSAALGGAWHLKIQDHDAAKERKLNWNK